MNFLNNMSAGQFLLSLLTLMLFFCFILVIVTDRMEEKRLRKYKVKDRIIISEVLFDGNSKLIGYKGFIIKGKGDEFIPVWSIDGTNWLNDMSSCPTYSTSRIIMKKFDNLTPNS